MAKKKFHIYLRVYIYLLILCIISLLKYETILCKFNKRSFLFKLSEVTLKTNGTGTYKILSDYFFQLYNQCQIYINDIFQNETKNEYDFNYSNNGIHKIRIIWDINVNTTFSMFSGCNHITEIDLSKFETSNAKNMSNMFYNCTSLISLNLSNIDTSKTTSMSGIFTLCSKLISLDLSYFNLSEAKIIAGMFYNCPNLEFINFKLLILSDNMVTTNLFGLNNNKLVVCLKNEDDKLSGLLNEKIDVYCNDNNSYHENINKCYSKDSKFDNKYICDICGKNYNIKHYISIGNHNPYFNCFLEIEGYYLNENDSNYMSCYLSCKECKQNGDNYTHNCIRCKEEYIYEINISHSNYKNCYINNPNQIIKTDINTYYFESNLSFRDINLISDIIFNGNTQALIENKTEIILNAIDELVTNFNIVELNNGLDKKIIINDKQIILTSTSNQKNNEEGKNITMDLGQCESILKNNYNISNNNSLYILQIVSEEKGMKIPKMEYEIYYPLKNDNELKKLNLTYCQGTKIDLSISVKIEGKLDKYNSSSNYYNDICYKSTSESGTDISLNDRRSEFVNNNISLCEENCDLIDYDYIKEKARCSCDIKTTISSYDDIKFNKNEFFKSFIDIKNIFNLQILKCYKTILKIKELKNNYGFYIISFVIVFYFITLLTFVIKSNNIFKKEVKNIICSLKFNEIPLRKNRLMKKPIIINKKVKLNDKKKYYNKKKEKIKLNKFNKSKIKNNSKFVLFNLEDNLSRILAKNKKEIVGKNNISVDEILKRKEFELNSLDYKEALKIDHRSYCQYYYHLLKYNHPISFSFATYNDYNIQIIKKFLFFFSFCSDLTINALFFTDETIHKIYQDKGEFNILYQIPQTLYSTLIGKFIDTIIKNLALSQDIIIELKEEKIKKLENKHKNLIRILNIKFTLFFILSLIALIFFWYYTACFCGIYINTQSHLIKDSIISLITSLMIPFGLYLIPGIFRLSAMNAKKRSHKYLYKFSIFLESYLC